MAKSTRPRLDPVVHTHSPAQKMRGRWRKCQRAQGRRPLLTGRPTMRRDVRFFPARGPDRWLQRRLPSVPLSPNWKAALYPPSAGGSISGCRFIASQRGSCVSPAVKRMPNYATASISLSSSLSVGGAVRIRVPFSVIATVCSKWALGLRSAVYIVQ